MIVLTACNLPSSGKPPTAFPTLALPEPVPSATTSSAATALTTPGASPAPATQAPATPTVVTAIPALPTTGGTLQPTLTAVNHVLGPNTRIYFITGATSSVINSTLNAGQSKDYVFYALANQVLLARLTTDNPGSVSLLDTNGNELPASILSSDGTFARSVLPSYQDYIVEVASGSKNIKYSLTITVPSRITFKQRATSNSVDGLVLNHNTVSYILRVLKRQTMTVSVSSSDGRLVLNIYGLEDDSSLVQASAAKSSWTGKLPSTQDYVIDVVPYVNAATFTLEVTIK